MSPTRAWLLGVAGLALVLRLAVVGVFHDARLISDDLDYHNRAVHILRHSRFVPAGLRITAREAPSTAPAAGPPPVVRDARRPPGYPLLVASVYRVAGERPVAVRVVQAVLGVATVLLTYRLACHLVTSGAAVGAAAVVAVYPAWLLFPVGLMAENLFTPLVLLGLWFWLRPPGWCALAGGGILALAALTRSVGVSAIVALVAGGVVGLWASRTGRPPSAGMPPAAGRLVLLLVGCLLVLSPWSARNWHLFGRPLFLDSASGENFLLGNNPLATGTLQHEVVPVVWARYFAGAMDDAERSAIGYREGFRFIREHPARTAALAARKLGYLVGLEGREQMWLFSQGVVGPRSPAAVWGWGVALLASFPLLMLVALAGLFRPGLLQTEFGRVLPAVLLGVALIHMASFGESRFHMPWVPLLAIAAARAFGRPARTGAPARWPWSVPRVGALGLAALALLLTWSGQIGPLGERLVRVAAMARAPQPLPY